MTYELTARNVKKKGEGKDDGKIKQPLSWIIKDHKANN